MSSWSQGHGKEEELALITSMLGEGAAGKKSLGWIRERDLVLSLALACFLGFSLKIGSLAAC